MPCGHTKQGSLRSRLAIRARRFIYACSFGLGADSYRDDQRSWSTMPRITLRGAMIALMSLTTVCGYSGTTAAARMATDQMNTQLAANPSPASTESGITGQVRIRPVRPHATIGVPNLAPYQAKFDVLNASGKPVTSFETDPNGNFRISLPPGQYILRPQTSGAYPRASEQTVVVRPKSFAQVEIVYDSGIR